MRRAETYVERRAERLVEEALEDTRVVVVNGARQVGKSTLAERVLRRSPGAVAKFLDESRTRIAAEQDSLDFLRHDALMLIDEVQRVPELWLNIKYLVDRDPRPGRFLLTGSARLLALKSLPDSLIGRAETIELWPLSQGEIDSSPDGFVDAAFRTGSRLRAAPIELGKNDYIQRALRGGYPAAVQRATPARRSSYFAGYVNDLLERDVRQVADISKRSEARKMLALLGGQVCGLFNASKLASRLKITAPTVRTYVEVLETVYLLRLLPAWSSGATTRAIAAPKLTFVDSGVAGHLARQAGSTLDVGGLLENFVIGELGRQLTWSETWGQLYHFRDREGREVDAVLESGGGEIVGIEVKASGMVRPEDFRGLTHLRDTLGDRFIAGFVLYCGDQSLSFGDRLTCLPISALWTTEP